MCGICGEVRLDAKRIDIRTIITMRQKIEHRGPDDHGIVACSSTADLKQLHFKTAKETPANFYQHPYNVVLAHTRLSIIDISASGHQPMSNIDQSLLITFNGEIYNYIELKETLVSLGYGFSTHSDTEVIMQAYKHWGKACLQYFNGMFSFVIWDAVNKTLFCARDRLGKKPLYYYYNSAKSLFVFASELSALMIHPEVPKTLSYEALNHYLALGYILSPLTVYDDIKKLEAAHYMLIDCVQATKFIGQYWSYEDCFGDKRNDNVRVASTTISDLLKQAVKRRLVGDVEVGAMLSGGLDSSAISSLAQQFLNHPLSTFSMGFEQDTYNELSDAKNMATWAGFKHYQQICSATHIDIQKAMSVCDEPFSDTSIIPMIELAKLCARHVKVVLSGDGADEIFAGYPTYKASMMQVGLQFFPKASKQWLLKKLQQRFAVSEQKTSFEFKLKQFLYGSQYAPNKAHYCWRLIHTPEQRVELLGRKYRALIYDTDPYYRFAKYYQMAKGLNPQDQHLFVDAKTWLADDILVKVDRASMFSGVEVRCPFLDIDLIDYVAKLPYQHKLHLSITGFNEKYALKKAMQPMLPKFVLDKKKAGFSSPIGVWNKEGKQKHENEYQLFNRMVFDYYLSAQ